VYFYRWNGKHFTSNKFGIGTIGTDFSSHRETLLFSEMFPKNVQTIGFTEQQRTLELNDKGNHNALRLDVPN